MTVLELYRGPGLGLFLFLPTSRLDFSHHNSINIMIMMHKMMMTTIIKIW